MIGKLVLENIKHKPVRTMLSVLLIGVPVTLILTLVGISRGFMEDSAKRARGIGADIVVRARGTSLITFSGAALPEKLVDALSRRPHVVLATGTINQPIGGFDTVTGIDQKSFDAMSGGFVFVEGHGFQQPNEIILDDFYARQKNVHAGGTVNILNRDWRVAGIVEPGKLSHIFLPLKVLQEATSNTAMVSQIYLKLDDPKNTDAVIADLKKDLPENPIYPMDQLVTLLSVDNVPLLRNFINVVLGIGVIIAFAVVSLSMYMAVLQRTREIGILKSLGASQWFVLEMILIEALMMGLGGTLLGILLSFATRSIMQVVAPASLPQAIVPAWWPIAGMIAMGAAILGALYPGMLAVRQDAIEALAYE